MSNLKRYSYTSEGMVSDEELGIVGGEFVKFDDVKEFLKPTANTGSPKLPIAKPCTMCSLYDSSVKSYNFCPNCGRQLRAGA